MKFKFMDKVTVTGNDFYLGVCGDVVAYDGIQGGYTIRLKDGIMINLYESNLMAARPKRKVKK